MIQLQFGAPQPLIDTRRTPPRCRVYSINGEAAWRCRDVLPCRRARCCWASGWQGGSAVTRRRLTERNAASDSFVLVSRATEHVASCLGQQPPAIAWLQGAVLELRRAGLPPLAGSRVGTLRRRAAPGATGSRAHRRERSRSGAAALRMSSRDGLSVTNPPFCDSLPRDGAPTTTAARALRSSRKERLPERRLHGDVRLDQPALRGQPACPTNRP